MTPVLELKDLHVTLRQHRRATELVKGVSFAVSYTHLTLPTTERV